jgi:hypothetical protein
METKRENKKKEGFTDLVNTMCDTLTLDEYISSNFYNPSGLVWEKV